MTESAMTESAMTESAMTESAMTTGLKLDYWEQRYQEGRTGWDLGQPAPPFGHLLAQQDAPQPGKMAVLGAGRGENALLFADRGFEVTGFDNRLPVTQFPALLKAAFGLFR